MPPVGKKLKWAGVQPPSGPARTGPAWKGPEEDGITFSLLSRFLVCRERFRLLVVEGLTTMDQFNHRLEFGQMWHTCEEALATGYPWEQALLTYARNLANRYPTAQEDVDKWYNVCRLQFPLCLTYWKAHPDVLQRSTLLAEVAFAVPYRLPSGRSVLLRGKWDSVDLIGQGKSAGIYLQENKTKGNPNEQQIKRQLTFDLQTMLYLTALVISNDLGRLPSRVGGQLYPIAGVRYNVVRRPLSGGKGTIVQGKGTQGTKCPKCKGNGWPEDAPAPCPKCGGAGRIGGTPPETKQEYFARLGKYIENEPDTYFMRWKVEVGPHDVQRFRRECLDPILESLCAWWDWVQEWQDVGPFSVPDMTNIYHWRHPFGCYNSLNEGGSSDLDEHLASGSEAGLVRTTNLFPELS